MQGGQALQQQKKLLWEGRGREEAEEHNEEKKKEQNKAMKSKQWNEEGEWNKVGEE